MEGNKLVATEKNGLQNRVISKLIAFSVGFVGHLDGYNQFVGTGENWLWSYIEATCIF